MSSMPVVPAGSEENAGAESVSSPANPGAVTDAQPVDDSGAENDTTTTGDSQHVQIVPASAHEHPVRVQEPNKKVTLGRHVHSEGHAVSKPKAYHGKEAEDAKVKTFTRGAEDRGDYPGVSPRGWNQNDVEAPNTKKK